MVRVMELNFVERREIAARVLDAFLVTRVDPSSICWAAWKAGIEPREASFDVLRALAITLTGQIRHVDSRDHLDWGNVAREARYLRSQHRIQGKET